MKCKSERKCPLIITNVEIEFSMLGKKAKL
jgi:hypothetical protein